MKIIVINDSDEEILKLDVTQTSNAFIVQLLTLLEREKCSLDFSINTIRRLQGEKYEVPAQVQS